jgi:hypothetical protein
MKNYKIAAALIGSFVLGAGIASVLHAQGSAPIYLVAMVNVKDQDAYASNFCPRSCRQSKRTVANISLAA